MPNTLFIRVWNVLSKTRINFLGELVELGLAIVEGEGGQRKRQKGKKEKEGVFVRLVSTQSKW